MPLDTRIPLLGRGVEIPQIDLGQTLAQVANLKQANQQLTLGELGLAKARREQAQALALEDAVRGAVTPEGQMDYGSLQAQVAKAGNLPGLAQIEKMRLGQSQVAENEAQAQERQLKVQQAAMALAHPVLVGIQKQPELYEQGMRLLIQQFEGMGMWDSANLAKQVFQQHPTYDAQLVGQLVQLTTDAKQRAGVFGVSPVYAEDEQGVMIGQLSRQGGVAWTRPPDGAKIFPPGAYAPKTVQTPTRLMETRPSPSGTQVRELGTEGPPVPLTPAQEVQLRDELAAEGLTQTQIDATIAQIRGGTPQQRPIDLAQEARTREAQEARGRKTGETQVAVLEKAKQARTLLDDANAKQAEALAPDGALKQIEALADAAGVYRPGGRELERLMNPAKAQRRADLEAHLGNLQAHVAVDAIQALKTFGGTLGPYTDKDSELLSNQISALKADMSPKALTSSIGRLRRHLEGAKRRREEAFARDYKGVDLSATAGTAQEAPPAPAPPAPAAPRGPTDVDIALTMETTNARRASRGEPPLSFDEVKRRVLRALENQP